ncbi:MAG: hypothetical protein HYX27_14445 [Acidobacteria bacterium]|nr:hypothetical protein [Acidobacteriota bacterium]
MTTRELLTRHAFSGLFRNDAFSEAGIGGYRAWIISIGVALFCFHVHFARFLAKKYAAIAHSHNHSLFLSIVAADELFYLSASFLMIALVATLQWQSLFPGERDFQVLSPLPVLRSGIFLSRVAALAIFLSLFLVTFNLPPALLFPAFARGPFPLESIGHRISAHLVSGIGASLHAFFCVLALQGLCLTMLPHRWRSRASFLIQSTLLVTAIAAIPIVWHVPGLNRLLDTRAEWLTWLPGVWWLGVCETLRGSSDPWFHAMSHRAMLTGVASVVIAAASYWRLYLRFSDFAAPPRTVSPSASPLLFLARRDDGGLFAFLTWTLLRSAQHRLILSGIAAVGASLALDGFISGYIRQWTRGRGAQGLFAETALALPLLLTFSLVAALRMSFRIPHEWRAHWIFKITEHAPSRPDQLSAATAAMYLFAVLPSILIALPFQFMALGPSVTLAALPLLAGINACLVEYTLQDWNRVPFTSTYAPGSQPAAISFILFLVAFSSYGYGGAAIVRALSRVPFHWFLAAAAISAAWYLLRRKRRAQWGHEPFTFADDGDPTVLVTNFAPE